jgi:hypothetical protein
MWHLIRRLFGSSSEPEGIRWEPGAPVVFLSLPPGLEKGVDPGVSQEQLLAIIREAARDLSQSQGFTPFSYSGRGGRRLPLFTSEERARTFVEAYVQEIGRIMPFQVLTAETSVLPKLAVACNVMVVDDRTSNAREIFVSATPRGAA